jgi:hypothetical protein
MSYLKNEYVVLWHDDIETFCNLISQHLNEGWHLVGGVAVLQDHSEHRGSFETFYQSMMKFGTQPPIPKE